jgi:hypothetical protein
VRLVGKVPARFRCGRTPFPNSGQRTHHQEQGIAERLAGTRRSGSDGTLSKHTPQWVEGLHEKYQSPIAFMYLK